METFEKFDYAILDTAQWYIGEYINRLAHDNEPVQALKDLAGHIRHPMNSLIDIDDDEYISLEISSQSWLTNSKDKDRVICTFRYDGIFINLSTWAIVSPDRGLIIDISTDLQGDTEGHLTDLIFFRSVSEKIFRSESYKTFSEISKFIIRK